VLSASHSTETKKQLTVQKAAHQSSRESCRAGAWLRLPPPAVLLSPVAGRQAGAALRVQRATATRAEAGPGHRRRWAGTAIGAACAARAPACRRSRGASVRFRLRVCWGHCSWQPIASGSKSAQPLRELRANPPRRLSRTNQEQGGALMPQSGATAANERERMVQSECRCHPTAGGQSPTQRLLGAVRKRL